LLLSATYLQLDFNDPIVAKINLTVPLFLENVYEEEEEEESGVTVALDDFISHNSVVATWRCQQITESGYMFPSHLVLTETHLVVLRDHDRSRASLVVKRPLTSIIKITAKKKHPDLITFKYGGTDSDFNTICDMDRWVFPDKYSVRPPLKCLRLWS